MSFFAPYAFTGAVSLFLGYKTYSSYYSNLDFEEVNKEDIEKIEEEDKINQDEQPVTKEYLVNEGKKKGEEIKVIIEEVKDEIEDFSYRTVDKIIEKALDKLEEQNPEEEEENTEEVQIPEVETPENTPEVETPEVETPEVEPQTKESPNVVLSNQIPETVFPEVENTPEFQNKNNLKKKKRKKKNKKK